MVVSLAGLCVLLLVVFCARLVAAFDEAELAMRSITSSVRALGRAARQVAPVSRRIGDVADAGGVVLARLEAMKRPAGPDQASPDQAGQ